ncbi:hypothetical protein BC628DRAFT_1410863 [Trametes gibbosa]|nr:hypothetical protein BC628DRAFT_1410863 [Trametes gibbosa]
MSSSNTTNFASVLRYLGLSDTYEPSPHIAPIDFLQQHVRSLPPQLLRLFSANTTPKQRTSVSVIRNRRLKYADSNPPELSPRNARSAWPALWEGRERPETEQAKDERAWADREFLGDGKQKVGNLGSLLGNYEEERESERVRTIRRQREEYVDSLPEEDDESDDEEEEVPEEPDPLEVEQSFVRSVKERFIYGLLESIDYDKVDWEERWDDDLDRDAEERWFDDEEEG